MEKIMVSISCITYNHEKYIAEAIESFLNQKTNFKYEILIHDDASTDETSEIIRKYQEKYPDIIKPILQSENKYSKGIKRIDYKFNILRSTGKYIAMCEGDDYWTDPYKLQKQVDYMEKNDNCSMCFHAAEKVTINKKRIGLIKPYNNSCITKTHDIIVGGGGFIATNSIMYRKNIMNNPPEIYFNWPVGDYPLQILTSMNEYAYYIDEIMSAYRVGVEGSWTNRMLSKEENEKKIINHNKKTIFMLNEFNKFSNERYINAVNIRILKLQFEILLIENKISELKNKKFRSIYNSLRIKEKIKIYARYYLPKTYKKFIYINNYLKAKI